MENSIKITNKITRLETQMISVDKKLDELEKTVDEGFCSIKKDLTCYVRKEEFTTVRSVVYGMVSAILTAFLAGVIYLVFK